MLNRNIIRSILLAFMLVPLVMVAQTRDSDVRTLHREIDKLSEMVEKLKAEQARSYRLEDEMKLPQSDFNKRDSLRLVKLRRKQAESRARIDQITLEILKLSKALEDPGRRHALAQRMKRPPTQKPPEVLEDSKDSTKTTEKVSARSIDLAAVKLVRQGKSLDQARLLTIDSLSEDQVLAFYRELEKTARYELYDIADEIVASEGVTLVDARRSAIYFYLFTK